MCRQDIPIDELRRIDVIVAAHLGIRRTGGVRVSEKVVDHVVLTILAKDSTVRGGVVIPELENILALQVFRVNLQSRMTFAVGARIKWIEDLDRRLLIQPKFRELQSALALGYVQTAQNSPDS